ncbi:MAG: succinate dehydrogenase assembly factor 2 [Gammaproteobacteria bacterium]|nr:MAG: succinate dehydrogenase assembly factor 2 [Gammaproteobacteria bacterium]
MCARDDSLRLRRLRWQCRRGMRELDLLLLGFLESGYGRLDPAGRAAFERLLEYPDPLLQELLFSDRHAADPELDGVLRAIRCTADG